MTTFQIKNKDKFIAYLKEAFELKKDGLKNEEIEEFHDICYILMGLIKNVIEKSVYFKHIIHSIIMGMDEYNFELFFKQLNDRIVGADIENYYFVATMNLDLNSFEKKEFTLDELTIYLKNYDEIEKEFKISQFFDRWHIYRPNTRSKFFRYSYAVIEIEENNANNAFEKGYSYSNYLEG